MQKNIKKRGARISAAVVIAFLLLYLAFILFLAISESMGDVIGILFLVIYGSVIAAVIFGITKALHQRIKEIEGGEEDVAAQY